MLIKFKVREVSHAFDLQATKKVCCLYTKINQIRNTYVSHASRFLSKF